MAIIIKWLVATAHFCLCPPGVGSFVVLGLDHPYTAKKFLGTRVKYFCGCQKVGQTFAVTMFAECLDPGGRSSVETLLEPLPRWRTTHVRRTRGEQRLPCPSQSAICILSSPQTLQIALNSLKAIKRSRHRSLSRTTSTIHISDIQLCIVYTTNNVMSRHSRVRRQFR